MTWCSCRDPPRGRPGARRWASRSLELSARQEPTDDEAVALDHRVLPSDPQPGVWPDVSLSLRAQLLPLRLRGDPAVRGSARLVDGDSPRRPLQPLPRGRIRPGAFA